MKHSCKGSGEWPRGKGGPGLTLSRLPYLRSRRRVEKDA